MPCHLLFIVLLAVVSNGVHIDDSAKTHNVRWKCPPNGITACCRIDGFGSQYMAMMSVAMYATQVGRPYCKTHWKRMEHWLNASEMFSWVGGELYGPPANNDTEHFDHKTEVDFIPDDIPKFRKFYKTIPKPKLRYFNRSVNRPIPTNFAWHLRRGDVRARDRRYTSNALINDGVHALAAKYPQMKTLHFFSQGILKNFQMIARHCERIHLNCEFHLRDSVEVAFHHLVSADILVTAHSSLSYAAGLLNYRAAYKDTDLAKRNFTFMRLHDINLNFNELHSKRQITQRLN